MLPSVCTQEAEMSVGSGWTNALLPVQDNEENILLHLLLPHNHRLMYNGIDAADDGGTGNENVQHLTMAATWNCKFTPTHDDATSSSVSLARFRWVGGAARRRRVVPKLIFVKSCCEFNILISDQLRIELHNMKPRLILCSCWLVACTNDSSPTDYPWPPDWHAILVDLVAMPRRRSRSWWWVFRMRFEREEETHGVECGITLCTVQIESISGSWFIQNGTAYKPTSQPTNLPTTHNSLPPWSLQISCCGSRSRIFVWK